MTCCVFVNKRNTSNVSTDWIFPRVSEMADPTLRRGVVDGIPGLFYKVVDEKYSTAPESPLVLDVIKYVARPEDVFIVTYPRMERLGPSKSLSISSTVAKSRRERNCMISALFLRWWVVKQLRMFQNQDQSRHTFHITYNQNMRRLSTFSCYVMLRCLCPFTIIINCFQPTASKKWIFITFSSFRFKDSRKTRMFHLTSTGFFPGGNRETMQTSLYCCMRTWKEKWH